METMKVKWKSKRKEIIIIKTPQHKELLCDKITVEVNVDCLRDLQLNCVEL